MSTCIFLIEYTLKLAVFLLWIVTLPIPKVCLISFNKAISLRCSFIWKVRDVFQILWFFWLSLIVTWKQPSTFVNPVKNQGFILLFTLLLLKVENFCIALKYVTGPVYFF